MINGPNRISTDNIALYFDASNTRCYKGYGTTYTDLSQYKNDGIFYNSPSFTTDNQGGIILDGTNYIDCGVSVSLQLTTRGSLSIWCKISDWNGSGNYYALAGIGSSAGFDSNGYCIWVYSNSVYVSVSNRTPTDHLMGMNVIANISSLGYTIHNYVLSWDSSNIYSYLDGAQTGVTSYLYGAGSTTDQSFYIGRNQYNTRAIGTFYNVSVYNSTLTYSDQLQNFNSMKLKMGI